MRLIVTGGGTGGHIYPALAIADKFKEMDPETQILYVGNDEGIEKDVVPKAGYDFEMVDARWLNKSNPYQLIKTSVRVMKGYLEARRVMKRFKPDVVIGTGGYVCFPVILAAHHFGARTFLHEQNAFPGLANRTLEKYVDKIFLGFGDAAKYFKCPEKMVAAGNPVRKSFFTMTQEAAREKLGYGKDDFIVFSFGGSLGSEAINEVAFELMKKLNGKPNTRMIFGTGKWYYEDNLSKAAEQGIELADNIEIRDYIQDMDSHLTAASVVISRAGALSVAETTVAGRPAILIPSPNVTGNHQYFNAKAVADRGGCVLIEEKDLSAERVIEEVMKLAQDREYAEGMAAASKACAPVHALDIIYNGVMRTVENER